MISKSVPRRLAVFLATSGHSGVDRIMKNLLPSIAARGVKVDLLQIKNHGPYVETAEDNLRVVSLGTSHAFTSFIPLVRYLRKTKPEVLLSDKYRVNRIALLASRLSGVPVDVFLRLGTTVSLDLGARKTQERLIEQLSFGLLYPWAKAVLTPSEAAAQDFSDFTGFPREKVRHVHSPVATPELYEKAGAPVDHPWFLEKSLPVIIGIGELSERKDFGTLIRAFHSILKNRPAKLVIIGKGRDRKLLEKLVSNLGLQEDVLFTGFIQNPYAYLARADLYVHSALWEGAPVALIEAVALGIPVVSTDCPSGPREILQNGLFGKLVPVGDVQAMAKAISQTLDAPMGSKFIMRAASPYMLDKVTDEYINLLGLN